MSSPSLRRRRAGAAAVAAVTIAAGVPLLVSAASAAAPTRLVITQAEDRTTAAAGTCTPFAVSGTDAFGVAADEATITVTITESPEGDTHDVDFCTVDGGSAFRNPPTYTNAAVEGPIPGLPFGAVDAAALSYNAGPGLRTTRSDPATSPVNGAAAGQDNPDSASGVEPGAAEGNTNNPSGSDRATFVSSGGRVVFGVVGLLPDARATVDAFVDTNANFSRNDDTDAELEDTVVATQRTVTFTPGGAPGSADAANAVRTVELTPEETFAALSGGSATHTYRAVLRNANGDRVAGVTPRILSTAGPNAAAAGSSGAACSATGNEGEQATCTFSATVAGTDTVTAFVNQTTGSPTGGLDSTEPKDAATATTTPPPVGAANARRLVVTPENVTVVAGQSREVVATVQDVNGAPAQGVAVTFAENGPGSLAGAASSTTATTSVSGTTDATGRLVVTLVTAAGDSGTGTIGATITTTGTQCTAAATGTTPAGQCSDTSPVTITAAPASPSATPTVTATMSPSPSTPPTTAPPAQRTAGRYFPVSPARLLDTRQRGGAVRANDDRLLDVTGVGGVPASGVSAVVLNVTVTQSSARGDLQVYPVGQRPTNRTSNLNFLRGQTVPVQVQTGVGEGGQVAFSVNTGTVQVIVDVFGYYGDASQLATDGSGYTALTPSRLLDTRDSSGVRAGADRRVVVAGSNGVPSDATAVLLNATALGAPANADLQVYPFGDRPTQRTSNLNVSRGQTKANAVTTPLGENGDIGLSVSQNTVQVVLDVLGYYSADGTGRFVPLAPQRILDTRTNRSPVTAGSDRDVTVAGQAGVPADATAAVLSVTATAASRSLDLQVFPTGDRPAERTSTLNLRTGEAVANLAAATLGADGQVTLSVSQGSASVVLDVLGYFTG